MPHEIEVKVLEVNKEEMIKKLLSFGAEKVFEGDIQAITYDFADGSLNKEKAFVRLRLMGEKTFITYKKKISKADAKIMEEVETEVGDFLIMQDILQKSGFVPQKDYRKHRESYRIGDTLFEFDDYEGIPTYMEIEAPSLERINSYVEKLDINPDTVKGWGAGELFEHYGVSLPFIKV